MTDNTKNFLTELAELLDKHKAQLYLDSGYNSTSLAVVTEKDTFTDIRVVNNNDTKYITSQDIKNLIV